MKLADFPPIKRFQSVPDQYYVSYPDCVYEEAVDYLIDIAERVEDNSIRRKLKAYKKKNFRVKKHTAGGNVWNEETCCVCGCNNSRFEGSGIRLSTENFFQEKNRKFIM